MPDVDADLAGPLSPPRDNGDIVFEFPWEQRIFGLTVALCRSETCAWESFRRHLIRRIADDGSRPYWESWAAALEDTLTDQSIVAPAELDDRQDEVLQRPEGH
jgi:nitrile hydratase accessory protein